MQAKTLTLHTPDLLGWVERSDIEIVRISIFFINLSTKTYLAGLNFVMI